MHALLGLIIF